MESSIEPHHSGPQTNVYFSQKMVALVLFLVLIGIVVGYNLRNGEVRELYNEINSLRQENERLQQNTDYLNERLSELAKENRDLKDRNDHLIEEINEYRRQIREYESGEAMVKCQSEVNALGYNLTSCHQALASCEEQVNDAEELIVQTMITLLFYSDAGKNLAESYKHFLMGYPEISMEYLQEAMDSLSTAQASQEEWNRMFDDYVEKYGEIGG